MKYTKIWAALTCALLAIGLLGCGTSNKLQTITLTATLINGVAPSSQGGFFSLQGNGGTIQLAATGTYTNTKTKVLTNAVTWNVIVDPQNNMDAFGNTLLPPCVAPCQNASQGTVEYNQTGLITAVQPATCTWIDIAPIVTAGVVPTPAWFYVGDYKVTVTYGGITSQPVYIPVASSAGNTTYNGQVNNPNGLCGPTS